MSNTRPVLNLTSAVVEVKGNKGYLISPWNSFFQQFVQQAPAIQSIMINPFQANQNGTVIITGTNIILTRGLITINLGTGQKIIPISIGDVISWSGGATVQFLGA